MEPIFDSKERFTTRAASYIAARPTYPTGLIDILRERCGLNPSAVVADIGSGTGMLSRLLCPHAQTVYGVEPNQAMRESATAHLSEPSNFVSVNGAAEATTLPATSVDLITAAQAFHWFNHDDTRHEFLRILKPNGWTAIIWNDRRYEGTPFAEAYEKLLETHGVDYAKVKARGKGSLEVFDRFFGHNQHKQASIKHNQKLDRDGFVQRIVSASYMPGPGHPRRAAMIEDVNRVFDEHQSDERVEIEYTTNIYYGQMT